MSIYKVKNVTSADLKDTKTGTQYINLCLLLTNPLGENVYRYKKSWLPNEKSAIKYLEREGLTNSNEEIEKRINYRIEKVKDELILLGFFGSNLTEACNAKFYGKDLTDITCTINTNTWTNAEGVEKTNEEVGYINSKRKTELSPERVTEISGQINKDLDKIFKVELDITANKNKKPEVAEGENAGQSQEVPF